MSGSSVGGSGRVERYKAVARRSRDGGRGKCAPPALALAAVMLCDNHADGQLMDSSVFVCGQAKH